MAATPDAAVTGEPTWPADSGPYLFLVDVSSKLEYDLLVDWVRRHRPSTGESVVVAKIPASRRITGQRLDPRVGARLAEADDPLLVPLRVVWLPENEAGSRRVRVGDMLVWGDPRDPGPLRQRWIARRHPDRVAVVMGEPARKSEVDVRWRDPGGRGPAEGTPLEEFVALQAWLALERAERQLRGSRYKVPKFIKEDLYWRRSFQRGIAELAMAEGRSLRRMRARTARYLAEIAATHSPYVIDLVTAITGSIIAMAHRTVDYDPAELDRIYQLGQREALVFLPSHKSNFDHLVLSYVLYHSSLPQNHTAGGINLNFFPIGPLLRRTGIFFIRREFKDNEPYKLVLRSYIEYLLEKRFPLEWYVEGGRSRTGKLREPRLGLLSYVAQTYTAGLVDDVILLPVSIMYDQITDVAAYAAEQRGGAKERESFTWVVKYIANARRPHGTIYLRFGEPIHLADRLEPGMSFTVGPGRLAVPRLAFEVSTRINEVTPITAVSLVSLALLGAGRPMDVTEVKAFLGPFLSYVAARDLPVASGVAVDPDAAVEAALESLADNGTVARVGATHYSADEAHALAVAYYRNAVVHHFLDRAIAEVAVAGTDPEEGFDAVFARALGMRDLLKFEFFFARRDEFRASMEREVAAIAGDAGTALAPAVLGPFLDAYQVVADVLVAAGDESLTGGELTERSLAVAERLVEANEIAPEARSTSLFASAGNLAGHRGLLRDDREGRRDLAEELAHLRHGVALVAGVDHSP